jgi:Mobilization protein NikA
MARPQKSPDDRATAAFRVRLTAAERAQLDTKAAAAGCTLSRLARAALLRYRLPPAPVTRDAVNELNRIGINLNQIARHLNSTGELRDRGELREALALHQRVLGTFLELILTRTVDPDD